MKTNNFCRVLSSIAVATFLLTACNGKSNDVIKLETPVESTLLAPVMIARMDAIKPTLIRGHNLSLESTVQIVYYVKNNESYEEKGLLLWKSPQESYDYNNAEFILKSSTPEVVDEVEYDTYYFDKMAAKEMTDYVYARSYIKTGDSYTYSELDRYSILDYCHNKKDDTSTVNGSAYTLGEITQDILNYGANAQKYFNYNTKRLANAGFHNVVVNDGYFLVDKFSERLMCATDYETLYTTNTFTYWNCSNGTYGMEKRYVVRNVYEDISYSLGTGTYYKQKINWSINKDVPSTDDAVMSSGADEYENFKIVSYSHITSGKQYAAKYSFTMDTEKSIYDYNKVTFEIKNAHESENMDFRILLGGKNSVPATVYRATAITMNSEKTSSEKKMYTSGGFDYPVFRLKPGELATVTLDFDFSDVVNEYRFVIQANAEVSTPGSFLISKNVLFTNEA